MKTSRPALLLLSAVVLLLTGCAESPYHAFCKSLSGKAYDACLEEPAYRAEYARRQATRLSAGQAAMLDSYPGDILRVDAEFKRTARRVEAIHQVPNISILPDNHDPDLVGQIFVVRASFGVSPESDDGGPSLIFDSSDDLAIADAAYLSSAQLDYLSILCYSGLNRCEGDVYLRMTRVYAIDWIKPNVVAVDVPSLSREDFFRRSLAFYEGWLDRLSIAAEQ